MTLDCKNELMKKYRKDDDPAIDIRPKHGAY